MRFLFLNQYFPPDPAPTGILLRELADELVADGHSATFVAARQDYRAGQRKGGRMIREFRALGRMLLDGFAAPRADVVISLTSPPCLLPAAALIAARHRARHFHWIMDLYPEIAVALGEIRPGILERCVSAVMRRGYRGATKVVVLDEDMAACVSRHGVQSHVIRPWVFASVLPLLEDLPAEPEGDWTWVYSGNLGRAHEWETLLAAQSILEQRGADVRLLFQGGGPSWPAAQDRARELGLQRIEWRPYVEEAELPRSLARCQVLVVTQLPAVQGMLWPSKLGLVLSLRRPIAWVGPADGAIARTLRKVSHAGTFSPGDAAGLAEWILARRAAPLPAVAAVDPAAHRRAAMAEWKSLLGGGAH